MFGKKYCNRCSRYMRQTKYIDFINCNKRKGQNEICEIMYKPVLAIHDYFRILCEQDEREPYYPGERCLFIPSQYILSGTQACIGKLELKFAEEEDRYLICGVSKTNDTAPYDTQFGISGKLKVGENIIQGAIRETEEELHYTFEEDAFQEIYTESSSQKSVTHYLIDLNIHEPTKRIDNVATATLDNLDDTSRRVIMFVVGSREKLLQYFLPMTSSELLGIDCLKIKNLALHFESHCNFYTSKFTF
jgi:hypothetical protein